MTTDEQRQNALELEKHNLHTYGRKDPSPRQLAIGSVADCPCRWCREAMESRRWLS